MVFRYMQDITQLPLVGFRQSPQQVRVHVLSNSSEGNLLAVLDINYVSRCSEGKSLAVLCHKLLSLLDASNQFRDSSGQKALLKFSQCSKSKVLLNSIGSQHKWSCKVFCLGDIALDIGALSHSLHTLHALDQAVSEPGGSVGHGEGGRASAILGLHHLSAGVLDADSECAQGVGIEGDGRGALGDKGHDGDASVPSDDWAVHLLGVDPLEGSNELVGADDIEGGDTEDLLGVVDAGLLVHLSSNRHSRVDWVGDDANHGIRTDLGSSSSQGGDNGGVGIEEVVPGHAGLPGDSSRDDHDFGTNKRGLQLVSSNEARNTSRGLNVGEVSSDARGGDDVIEGQFGHCWVQLQQH